MDKFRIDLPRNVDKIITTLQENGFEAYAVGGCVRDSILGRVPGDWDITTSAMPEETKALFQKTFDTGIEHGTVTVLLDGEGYEVTTYRIDGEYEDSRHPKEVTFTRSLEEDLLRRDFTINAMAYNKKDGLVDLFGGIEDIRRKTIRCVGDAHARFSEDALRILRGIRFAAQLGFAIEADTRKGMKELAPTLKNISAERIQVELIKTVVSTNPSMLLEAYELGITKQFLPEFDQMMETEQENPHHKWSVGVHSIRAMENIRNEKVLRLAMLLHDVGKPFTKTIDENGVAHFYNHSAEGEGLARRILRNLKFDNDTLNKVTKLVLYHDYRMPAIDKNIRRAINKIGEELFPYYLEVYRADILAQSEFEIEEKLRQLNEVEEIYKDIIEKGQCVSLKTLAVSGKDLIQAGMKPGKEIGDKLGDFLELVLDNPELNTKEELLSRL